jgi:hypothetical protein
MRQYARQPASQLARPIAHRAMVREREREREVSGEKRWINVSAIRQIKRSSVAMKRRWSSSA